MGDLFIALIQMDDVCGLSRLSKTETGSRQLWNVNPSSLPSFISRHNKEEEEGRVVTHHSIFS